MSSMDAYLRFEDSSFAQYDDPSDGFVTPNLENDIHPLFQRSMFSNLSSEEYTALKVPLQLATRLLLDDRATKYVLTMTNRQLHSIDADGSRGPKISPSLLTGNSLDNRRLLRSWETPNGELVPGSQVTAVMQLEARNVLEELVETLDRIEVAKPDQVGNMTVLSNTTISAKGRRDFPAAPGTKTLVYLKFGTVWDYRSRPKNSLRELEHHHHTARTLVHEVAHVLSGALHGARSIFDEDVFIDAFSLNEAGYNLETMLFGGIYDSEKLSKFTTHLNETIVRQFSLEYPCQRILDEYAELDASMNHRSELDSYYSMSHIPLSFIAAMFTEEYWTRDAPAMNSGPLQPAMMRTWFFIDLKVGAEWVNDSGMTVRVGSAGTVPCRMDDETLPVRVQDALCRIALYEQGLGMGQ